uniref:C2 domain-containing protein n=1 Tax=Romanomermis culicivorax TaxID=13658 RepID=A0A915L6F2_ROMCU
MSYYLLYSYSSLKPESEKHHRAKTKVKKKTLNPEFNEEFEFCVTLGDLPKKILDLSVWDRDVGKQDDFIGKVQLGVNAKTDRQKHWLDCIRSPDTTFQRWHKLQGES